MQTRKRRGPGGARPGAGRKPSGTAARSVPRTVRLEPAEAEAQDRAAGETPWATWAHRTLVAAAAGDD